MNRAGHKWLASLIAITVFYYGSKTLGAYADATALGSAAFFATAVWPFSPDVDLWLPFARHRGFIHSIRWGLILGLAAAGIVWYLQQNQLLSIGAGVGALAGILTHLIGDGFIRW